MSRAVAETLAGATTMKASSASVKRASMAVRNAATSKVSTVAATVKETVTTGL